MIHAAASMLFELSSASGRAATPRRATVSHLSRISEISEHGSPLGRASQPNAGPRSSVHLTRTHSHGTSNMAPSMLSRPSQMRGRSMPGASRGRPWQRTLSHDLSAGRFDSPRREAAGEAAPGRASTEGSNAGDDGESDDESGSSGDSERAGAGVSADTLREAAAGKALLNVEVKLRAIVPAFTADSLAVAARLGMRVAAYENMAPAWRERPAVSVVESPEAWWRHAISMVVAECRKHRRRKTTIYAALRRRRTRERYTRLYQRAHTSAAPYHDPGRTCAPCCLFFPVLHEGFAWRWCVRRI
jgi:Vacuolar sorting-associated protein 13, N-terminal